MGNPFPVLLIIGAYLIFVSKLAPYYMKNREPYKLNGIMIVYNIGISVASAIVGYGVSIT